MKRRTLMTLAIILALLTIAIPASALTAPEIGSIEAGYPRQLPKHVSADLLDLNTLPEGYHDNSDGLQNQFFCRADGWAADPDDPTIDLNIRVFSDGVEVAQTVADTFRQDLADAGVCVDGTCSFSVDLWGLISPDVDHLITVQMQDAQTGEWVDLFNTPKTLHCFEENIWPEGYHDGLEGFQSQSACLAVGWVTDPNDRNIDLTIRILADGLEVAQTIADMFRQDLEDAGICPGGTCSFSVDLAGLISPDVDHSITVQAQDLQTGEWVDLFDTPRILNCMSPTWEQVNLGGFGDPTTNGVISLETFRGQVYAGTANGNMGGQVWRWNRDGQGEPVSEAGFGAGPANPAIIDLAVYRGNLYAGMGWNASPGQVWRSADGTSWEPVTVDGFGDAGNIAITIFASFKGMLYAGTGQAEGGAQIWRSQSGNPGSWTQVAPDGPGFAGNVTSLESYRGMLYAALEPSSAANEPIQIWRSSNGSDWVPVTVDGFGDPQNLSTGGFAQFRGYLYLGLRNESTGGQLWRTRDGLQWEPVISDGFGDPANVKIESLLVHDGKLVAVTFNGQSGLQVWHSTDGTSWEIVSTGGFGHPGNFSTLWNNAILNYRGRILLGTWNDVDGGELWMSLK